MSWKGFMNKLVVGKKRDKDFNRSNLPTNRRQVFKFAYKQRWLTLFNVNLLAVLFALPFILFEITYFIYSSTHAGESVTKQNSIAISCFLIRFPTLLLASVGLAGAVYIIRKICWDEPFSFKKDFFKGVSNSSKQFMGISAVISVFVMIAEVLVNYYSSGSGFLNLYIVFTIAVLAVIALMVAIYHFAICSLYKMSFLSSLKLAILLTFKKLFFNILMLIVGVLPVAIFFLIPITTFYFIGVTILLFGGLSYLILVCFLFTNATFDKFINEKEYPEFVRKGMYDFEEEKPQTHSEEEIKNLAKLLAEDAESKDAINEEITKECHEDNKAVIKENQENSETVTKENSLTQNISSENNLKSDKNSDEKGEK